MRTITKQPSGWEAEKTQQYLSNVYWYFLITKEIRMKWALDEIRQRFNGKLLEYRPSPEFKSEIKRLQEKGILPNATRTLEDIKREAIAKLSNRSTRIKVK